MTKKKTKKKVVKKKSKKKSVKQSTPRVLTITTTQKLEEILTRTEGLAYRLGSLHYDLLDTETAVRLVRTHDAVERAIFWGDKFANLYSILANELRELGVFVPEIDDPTQDRSTS